MTVSLTRQTFGTYSLVTVGTSTDYVSFVAERSAYIHQLALGGKSLLWNYANAEALTINKGHRNLALLPFANRLGTGRYSWAGQTHAFPINDPETGSALHGFNHEAEFALANVSLGATSAQVKLRYLHTPALHRESYPFLVLFEVELHIDCKASVFRWKMTAQNLDVLDVPVGLGWHPYFAASGGVEPWSVQLPPNERVELRHGLPTGLRLEGLPPKPVAVDPNWDDCFVLSESGNKLVHLHGPEYALALEQGGETANIQLFVPPTQDALAIEPVTCAVDAFRQNPLQVALPPGQQRSCSMRISLLT